MSETDVLIFGPDKDMILCFVIKNSHEFSFVFWATIDLARKFFPNVNQFFESLYVLGKSSNTHMTYVEDNVARQV